MAARIDALLFVEDPGAANYVVQLPQALATRGKRAILIAAGTAIDYLRDRSCPFETLSADADARALLAERRPALVAVGTSENPRTFGLALVDAAREAGIPCVGLVDGFANAAFRFRGEGDSPRAHAPDWLAVPDQPTADAFAGLGWAPARVRALGHPHWDEVRRAAAALAEGDRAELRRALLPGCGPDRPAVVFASELSDGLDAAQYRRSPDYTLAGKPASQGRTEIVLDEFLEAAGAQSPRPYLILRLHPKQGPDDLAAYRSAFDQVSRGGPALQLLYAADAVIGMTSMLLQEAALLGRPTLAIVPREAEKDWLPTIAMGVTPCATRKAQVTARFREALGGFRTEAALRFAGAQSGDCAGRTAVFLANLAEENRA